MIAKQRIEVVLGGVLLAVPAGGVVHPAIIESWRAAGKLERAIAQGVIADDEPKPLAEPAPIDYHPEYRQRKSKIEKDTE
jgi:hypothetical protein